MMMMALVVMYLELVENIDQMHESTFISHWFIEIRLMMSSI